ncbi:MAG: hypothetical protein RIQ56_241 [Candidatus Parcubacteria bacterium]
MQRIGRINQPSFRIIVTEHARSPKTGNIVEQVGTYNPTNKQRTIKEDRIKYWLSVGAKPSITIHNMFVQLGLVSGKKKNALPKKTVEKKEAEAAPAEAAAPAAQA